MDKDKPLNEQTNDEEALSDVASLITPLPENVIPSDEFLRRTRRRILELEGRRRPRGQQAA